MFGKFKYELSKTKEKSPEKRGIFNYLKSFTQKVGKYLFEEDENQAMYQNDNLPNPNNYDTSGIYDSPSLSYFPNAYNSTPIEKNPLNFSSNSNIRLSNYNLLESNLKDESKSCESTKERINEFCNHSKKKKVSPVIQILNYITGVTIRPNRKIHKSAFNKLNESDGFSIGAGVNFKKIVEEDEDILKPTPIIVSTFDGKKRKRMREDYSFDKINPKKSDKKQEFLNKIERLEHKSSSAYSKYGSIYNPKTVRSKQEEFEKSLFGSKSNNSKSFMNVDEVNQKNDFERRKRILTQYRQSCDRRSQDFDYLRYGKSIDSLNSSKNQSRTEMDISISATKEVDQKDSFNLLNNTSQDEIKKDKFKMPENPKKNENISLDNISSNLCPIEKFCKNEVSEEIKRPVNANKDNIMKESESLHKKNYFSLSDNKDYLLKSEFNPSDNTKANIKDPIKNEKCSEGLFKNVSKDESDLKNHSILRLKENEDSKSLLKSDLLSNETGFISPKKKETYDKKEIKENNKLKESFSESNLFSNNIPVVTKHVENKIESTSSSSLFNLKDNKDKNLAKPSLNSENQEKNTSSLFAIFNHEAKSEKSSFINDFTSKEKKIDNTSVNSTPSLFNSIKVENGSEKTSTPSLFNFIKVEASEKPLPLTINKKEETQGNNTSGQIFNKLQTTFNNNKKNETNEKQKEIKSSKDGEKNASELNLNNSIFNKGQSDLPNITQNKLFSATTVDSIKTTDKKNDIKDNISIFSEVPGKKTSEESKLNPPQGLSKEINTSTAKLDNSSETAVLPKSSQSLLNNNNPFINVNNKAQSMFSSATHTKSCIYNFNSAIVNNSDSSESLFKNAPKNESSSLFNQSTAQPTFNSESSLFAKGNSSLISGNTFKNSENTQTVDNKAKNDSNSLNSKINNSSSIFTSEQNNSNLFNSTSTNKNFVSVNNISNPTDNEESMVISPQMKPQPSYNSSAINLISTNTSGITNQNTSSLFTNKQSDNKNNNSIFSVQPSSNTCNTASLFGNQPTVTNNSPSLFGNQPTVTNNSPSLFGNQPTVTNNTPSLFGNQPTVTNNSPSLFGNQPTVTNNTPSLFGNQQIVTNNTASLFGNQPSVTNSTPSLFGNQQIVSNNTASLFGNQPSVTNSTSSLFGNQPSANTNSLSKVNNHSSNLFSAPNSQINNNTNLFNNFSGFTKGK